MKSHNTVQCGSPQTGEGLQQKMDWTLDPVARMGAHHGGFVPRLGLLSFSRNLLSELSLPSPSCQLSSLICSLFIANTQVLYHKPSMIFPPPNHHSISPPALLSPFKNTSLLLVNVNSSTPALDNNLTHFLQVLQVLSF